MATSGRADRATEENQHESGAACPKCGRQVRIEQWVTVCTDCGLLLDDQPIDTGPEERAFDGVERERTGRR